jgi:hypothetical protein
MNSTFARNPVTSRPVAKFDDLLEDGLAVDVRVWGAAPVKLPLPGIAIQRRFFRQSAAGR